VDAVVRKASSLLSWLQQHGHLVRSLDVWLIVGTDQAIPMDVPNEQAQMVSVLDSCISACAANLESIYMKLLGFAYTLGGGWIATANKLQHLRIDVNIESDDSISAYGTLTPLTSLLCLDLNASELRLGTAAALPASLTCLHLTGHHVDSMPPQVRKEGQSRNRKHWQPSTVLIAPLPFPFCRCPS
jgi:hypothetical protein